MNFLKKLGFSKEEIEEFENSTADVMLEALNASKKLVQANFQFLEGLGVKNAHDIFFEYYELFLMDHSYFMAIFNKYDQEDLVEKLEKNIAIIEYL